MLLAQGAAHSPSSLEVLLVVLVILAVLFWRGALRILIAVSVILLIAGAHTILQHLQHLK
jgi:hypothetical protein